MQPKEYIASRNALGESPIWRQATQCLCWLDILKRELFVAHCKNDGASYDLSVYPLPIVMTAMDFLSDDMLIMVGLGGIYHYDLRTHHVTLHHAFIEEYSNNRPNDGKLDPYGRFWFGTMDNKEKDITGSLYSYHDGVQTKWQDNIGISNGFGWSPDGQYFYNCDSMKQEIYRYDYNGDNGHISNKRVFISLQNTEFFPDGLCVDHDGIAIRLNID